MCSNKEAEDGNSRQKAKKKKLWKDGLSFHHEDKDLHENKILDCCHQLLIL